jgi:hypothetical protein
MNSAEELSLFILGRDFLHAVKSFLRHGADNFTSPPKEGVLRNSIALKNASPSARNDPANFGSNGRHGNEDDKK